MEGLRRLPGYHKQLVSLQAGGCPPRERLQNDEKLKQIPVVVLTSSTEPEDVAQSYELGANAYVHKPLELKEFFAMVHELIGFWYQRAVLPSAVATSF